MATTMYVIDPVHYITKYLQHITEYNRHHNLSFLLNIYTHVDNVIIIMYNKIKEK